jgi:succinate dehydrogenase / fumarate reductase cytochrome b subunit
MAISTRRPGTDRGREPRRSPRAPVRTSTVVLKAVMAVSGIVLLLYLTAHMLGNLKIFLGEEDFDHYAHWLRGIGAPAVPHSGALWTIRVVLAVAVVAHMWTAIALARRARAARPVRYAHRPRVPGSYAARTMRWGGVIIALFVVYHLLDLTAGVANPAGEPGRPYTNVTADFRHWWITAVYVLAVLAVGLHLRHGVLSATRSLGRHRPGSDRAARLFANGYAAVMTAGFLSVPLAVSAGLVG